MTRKAGPWALVGWLAGLGVAVGVLWFLLAPTPEYEVRRGGLYFSSTQPAEFIAMDGWFAGLALLAGLVTAVVAVRRDDTGPLSLVVLAVGGLVAGVLAWQVGHLLGPETAAMPGRPVEGMTVRGPLDLHARGVLAVWPVTSLAVVLLVLGWRQPDESGADADEPAGSGASVPRDPDLGDVDRGE